MKHRLLLILALVMAFGGAMGQTTGSVTMYAVDGVGNSIPLTVQKGSTIYLPQVCRYSGNSSNSCSWTNLRYDIIGIDTTLYAVIVDKDGVPYDQIRMDWLHRLYAFQPSVVSMVSNGTYSVSMPSRYYGYVMVQEESAADTLFNIASVQLSDDGNSVTVNRTDGTSKSVYMDADTHIDLASVDASVAGALSSLKNEKIIYWAAYSDQNYSSSELMGLYFNTFLEAKGQNLVMFAPSDDGLYYNYDPMSFTSNYPRVMRVLYNGSGRFPFDTKVQTVNNVKTYVVARYDQATGAVGADISNQTTSQTEILNRLRQMLMNHCITLSDGESLGSSNLYYNTIGGAPLKVIRKDGNIVAVQGGYQMENDARFTDETVRSACSQGVLLNNILTGGARNNGSLYTLDSPMVPASRSVYSLMGGLDQTQSKAADRLKVNEGDNPYWKFFALCSPQDVDPSDAIVKSGLVDESQYDVTTTSGKKARQNAINRYLIFVDDYAVDYNLSFLKSGSFTLFAPTNDAVDKAISQGLPTWESIVEDYNNCKDGDGNVTSHADSVRLQTNIKTLVRCLKSHFVFGCHFNDAVGKAEQVTGVTINEKGGKMHMTVNALGGNRMTVTDSNGKTVNVTGKYNVPVSEYHCSAKVKQMTSLNSITIDSQSYGMVHQIDGVMNFQ